MFPIGHIPGYLPLAAFSKIYDISSLPMNDFEVQTNVGDEFMQNNVDTTIEVSELKARH